MISEQQQNAIDAIMDSFNFARVAKCMEALNWGWGEQKMVPDEATIRKSARSRMRTACEQYNKQKTMMYVSSGGLVASCDGKSFRLAFEVADLDEDISCG